MNTAQNILLGFALMAGSLAAQNPSFTGVVNPASNIPPGMPNYGIAQGSIFVIYGSNLGPASLAAAPTPPLPTTAGLAGTSITITVNGTTVTAPIVYCRTDVVAAVLPSNTPVGSGTLTLTFNGKSSSTPITVVQSNFGISTANESGSGSAVVTRPDFTVITNTNSAKPGDPLVLWGTGLGPITSSDAVVPVSVDLGTPIQVFVGGVEASVTYRGRSAYPGLDQINIVVPQTVPVGCNVGVIVQTSGTSVRVSNAPTIAIAPNGGACSDPTQSIPISYLTKSSVKAVYINLNLNVSIAAGNGPGTSPTTSTNSSAEVVFFQFSQAQLAAAAPSANAEPTLGTCLTGIVAGSGGGGGLPQATYLNAGTSVTLTPPSGSPITLYSQTQGSQLIYQDTTLTAVPTPGTWNFSNVGGPDVGPLSFSFPIPAKLAFGPISGPIDRTQPLTITWTGGDTNGYVDIYGQGQIGTASSPTYTFYFDCSSPTSTGQFTIPSAILRGLPNGLGTDLQTSLNAFPSTLPAIPGFDLAVDGSAVQHSAPLGYK